MPTSFGASCRRSTNSAVNNETRVSAPHGWHPVFKHCDPWECGNGRSRMKAAACGTAGRTAVQGRQGAFDFLDSGHSRPTNFTDLEWPQWPNLSRCARNCHCPLVGHCRHWGRSGSTSAMWRITDRGSVEQSNGSFLHQRTHTPDPLRPLNPAPLQWQLPRVQRSSARLFSGRIPAKVDCRAVGFSNS
jgi:hypothetical protein